MKTLNSWLSGHTAVCLALSLAIPVGQASSAAAQQEAPSQQPMQEVLSAQAKEDRQAKNAATDTTVSAHTLPDSPAPVNSQAPTQQGQTGPSASGTGEPDGARKPVGTAAAPYERTSGVAASRPAGAAIAPAKQRRVRTFLISAGLIAGAAIAVGSVAALSHGSSSHP
jgi:Flp pilus assembly protein TadG